jgi:hypothetical protein
MQLCMDTMCRCCSSVVSLRFASLRFASRAFASRIAFAKVHVSHWLTGRREPYKGSAALSSLPVLDDAILPSRAASVSPERVHHPHRAAKHRSHATASTDVAHAHKRSIGRLRAPVERTTSEAESATWTQPRPFLKMPEQNGTVAASPLCDAQSSMPCHAGPCGPPLSDGCHTVLSTVGGTTG